MQLTALFAFFDKDLPEENVPDYVLVAEGLKVKLHLSGLLFIFAENTHTLTFLVFIEYLVHILDFVAVGAEVSRIQAGLFIVLQLAESSVYRRPYLGNIVYALYAPTAVRVFS